MLQLTSEVLRNGLAVPGNFQSGNFFHFGFTNPAKDYQI
jgi:hypothetical protein